VSVLGAPNERNNIYSYVKSFMKLNTLNLNVEFLGNTLQSYIEAVGAFLLLAILFKFVQYLILRRLAKLAEKTETDIDDTFIEIVRSLKPAFYYFVAFYFGVSKRNSFLCEFLHECQIYFLYRTKKFLIII